MKSSSKQMIALIIFISLTSLANSVNAQDNDGFYNIGTGIGDITGPAGGSSRYLHTLSQYVNNAKVTAGIHTRLYARSFIVESITTKNRVVFVSCDLGMMDFGLKAEVIKKLGDSTFTPKNVQISATHIQSGPAGYMQYYAFVASYKYDPLLFWAIVDGIVESIQMANAALTRGQIFVNKGQLNGYSENGDIDSYLANPEEGRNKYNNTVDTEMILLKFETESKQPIGAFNWWPVHPISFNGWDNPLISSDSKGYASVKFDYEVNKGDQARPGGGKFVSAFANSNLGDVNPTAPTRLNMANKLKQVAILGQAQFQKALNLFNDNSNLKLVTGHIDSRQQYVEMPQEYVQVPEGSIKLCRAALGYSFLGLNKSNLSPVWKVLLGLTLRPTIQQIRCQQPKETALSIGEWAFPWKWAPSKVDLNILRIGSVNIVSAPGELTTMAGRRLKKAIEDTAPDQEVIISGLANNYINSIATPEEYYKKPQGYAGGATLYGPYTLNAIINRTTSLMTALHEGLDLDNEDQPGNLTDVINKWIRPKKGVADELPQWPDGKFGKWGGVVTHPKRIMHPGETLLARFVSPIPKLDPVGGNNRSYFAIQVQDKDNKEKWIDVRTDADLDTTFWWNKINNIADVYWLNIPKDIPFGTYRVYHSGYVLKSGDKKLESYNGVTETFQIVDPNASTSTPSSTNIFISSDVLFLLAAVTNVINIYAIL